jgi:hypothetical protein
VRSMRSCSRFAGACLLLLVLPGLAGCVSGNASPSKPVSGGATLASTVPSDMQFSSGTTATVPANGYVDVPIAFEGSSVAVVAVSNENSDIGATFGGLALAPSGDGSLSVNLSSPADGPLHVTNSSGQNESVGVIVMIESGRSLAVTASPTTISAGQAVSIDVVLTQPVAGDSVGGELVDPAATHTPITLSPAGSGHWTGQVSPSVGGDNTINVWTNGNGTRRASTLVVVAGGSVTLGSGFTERLNDTNGDSLADQLIVTLPATVAKAGTYQVRARLVDSAGNQVAGSKDPAVDLQTGSQTLTLTFAGADIYSSGRSGPYRVVSLQVFSNPGTTGTQLEASATDLGATQAYGYQVFQR